MKIRINNGTIEFAKNRNLYDPAKDIIGYYINAATTGTNPKRAIEGDYAISADIPVNAGDVISFTCTKMRTSNYIAMLNSKGYIVNGRTYEPSDLAVDNIITSKLSVTFTIPADVVAIVFTTRFNGKTLGDVVITKLVE